MKQPAWQTVAALAATLLAQFPQAAHAQATPPGP